MGVPRRQTGQGESGKECIVRELKEELDIDVEVESLFDEFIEDDLTILYYCVKRVSGGIALNEHEQVLWIPVNRLIKYDLLFGDKEIAKKLAQ